MHPSTVDYILNILFSNHISISDLLVHILRLDREQNINSKFDALIKDLFDNSDKVLDAFASHPATNPRTKQWAHTQAKDIYLEEIARISSKRSGFHFRAYGATSQQILGFDAATLIPRISTEVPFLWDLNRSLFRTKYGRKGFMDSDFNDDIDAHDVVCV